MRNLTPILIAHMIPIGLGRSVVAHWFSHESSCLVHQFKLSYDGSGTMSGSASCEPPLPYRWRAALLTAAQMKAARALVGMEQKALAEASGVSLPTIQRMEASPGVVRGVIESLMKVMSALEAAGVEFINEGAVSSGGGRGVRLRDRAN
jgi:hypothetical protein